MLGLMCHALGYTLKKKFSTIILWLKTNRMWFSVVGTLTDNNMHVTTAVKMLSTHKVRLVSRQHFDLCDNAYRGR